MLLQYTHCFRNKINSMQLLSDSCFAHSKPKWLFFALVEEFIFLHIGSILQRVAWTVRDLQWKKSGHRIQNWWSMKIFHNDFIHKATSNLRSLCVPCTNIVEASIGQFFTLVWWRTMISSWVNSTCKPGTIFEQWTLIQINSNTT